jgi:5-methylcytosine-specific restriction endonuclease McrA
MLCNNRNPVRIEKRRIKIRDIHKERGRKTSLDKTIRHSFEYKQWRTSIFERDNYTCQICGIRGRDLQADHIKPFAVLLQIHSIDSLVKSLSCNELWNINNGRTLCVQCHKKTGTYGRKLTTKQYENKRANISR